MSSSKLTGGDVKGELSKDETEIYDRQIRLWGLEAQNRYVTLIHEFFTELFLGYVIRLFYWLV